METKTVRKVFAEWSFDKEEEWLNSMAQEGWTLKKAGFCKYVFERTEPGEYIIRLEMHEYEKEYISFMRDTGAEYVGRVLQWLYFRKKAELGEFELFSDIDSRIAHLNRISCVLIGLGFANVAVSFACGVNGADIAGRINLLCACVIFYGLGRVHGKKEALERERRIRE